MALLDFEVYLNTLRLKGNLAYEYNPFHNYQTDVDLYEVSTNIGTILVPLGLAVNSKNGELLTKKNGKWIDKRGSIILNYIEAKNGKLFAKAGSLIDLDTDKLNFDLNHPVDITILPSYDGSVNLILNDNKNIPRLINSRFSAREKSTYEIVDRIGENDTNIYNSKSFDKDTSLYFLYEYNPIVQYMGYIKGILPVGLYCFYFTYCDADNNESDYITETGLIPLFIGSDKDPYSMDGGIKNLSSNKGVKLELSNIDKSYNYLKIYYVRYFADYLQNRLVECKKIYKKYPIDSDILYLLITGNEEAEDIDPNILNISKFNPKNVLTQAQCKNMLFFGNIVKNSDNYKELSDCALRIVPEIFNNNNFKTVDNDYNSINGNYGYYNSINIYNNVGYFDLEYYRFGVVFIYLNGTLSSVYNTLGYELTKPETIPVCSKSLFKELDSITLVRQYIQIDDKGWINDESYTGFKNLNSKGVCKFNYNIEDDNTILGIKFNIPHEVIEFLKNDLNIRGLFFVRQKCVPNILAQCYLLPMDELMEGPVIKLGDDYYTETFVSQGYEKKIKIPTFNTEITEIKDAQLITNDYNQRLYKYKNVSKGDNVISENAYAAICPDFLLNLPYYNQIFNGSKFRLKKLTDSSSELKKTGRFYKENDTGENIKYLNDSLYRQVTISSVTEDVPTVAIKDKVYKLEMGETEEAYRFSYAEVDNGLTNAGDEDYESVNKATNIVRGKFSPYLAIYSSLKLDVNTLYNIYQDSTMNEFLEYQNRMNSFEPFYSISNRYNFDDLSSVYNSDDKLEKKTLICWRGDCYINTFTYRLNRNFNDPSLPNNDKIIDQNTWKENYTAENPDNWSNISRSDLNAVQMGSWITIKVRSAMNYALRSLDHSYVSEEALMGSPRSYYPRNLMMWKGVNKMPDSYLYNDAYRASLGYKCYYALSDVNYIKNSFSNRIQYSSISILDSFKNNYRDSLSTYFRDYSQEYGSILKLIGFEGHLLVIFEHGIGLAVVNERILAGTGDGLPVFINTQNVLPEELTIITDTYGTQWPESVVKSENGNVYGVDTIAKKIWRVKLGLLLEILSDFKVNKFLIDNISLGERELYPIVGLKNVKTHYNNNKKDVMFTFYDDIYKDEEKVWNLCYNELLEQFITFYSWIPSYSENIDTQFFTFDRNTSKYLSLLSKCNYNIPENTGVLLDIPVCKDTYLKNSILDRDSLIGILLPTIYYVTSNKSQVINYTIVNPDGTTKNESITVDGKDNGNGQYILSDEPFNCRNVNVVGDYCSADSLLLLDEYNKSLDINFKIERDHWGNDKLFVCRGNLLSLNEGVSEKDLYDAFLRLKVIILYITPYISNIDDIINVISGTTVNTTFKTETIALTLESIVNNPLLTLEDKSKAGLTTDFYLHGQAGIFNVVENLYPTHWYGEYHPFEFEFVVNDNVGYLKIFNNLILISNKAEPESFHFEIEGDNYDFSSDKRNMYFRLEATKNLYLNLGSDIIYDRKFTDVIATKLTYEQAYRAKDELYESNYNKFDRVYPVYENGLVLQVKSSIFPLYYERTDTYNEIYDKYTEMVGSGYDFKNLSGSEIKWNRDMNLFNVVTHIKNSPVDLVGVLRGNSRYKEGKWNIQIPSIIFMLRNEEKWNERASRFLLIDGPLKNSKLNIPPLVINSLSIPSDLTSTVITSSTLPDIYSIIKTNIRNTCNSLIIDGDNISECNRNSLSLVGEIPNGECNYNSLLLVDEVIEASDNIFDLKEYVNTSEWTHRKEAKIRDKWLKVRIRYSGKNLAIIHSIVTLYNRSYS